MKFGSSDPRAVARRLQLWRQERGWCSVTYPRGEPCRWFLLNGGLQRLLHIESLVTA